MKMMASCRACFDRANKTELDANVVRLDSMPEEHEGERMHLYYRCRVCSQDWTRIHEPGPRHHLHYWLHGIVHPSRLATVTPPLQ